MITITDATTDSDYQNIEQLANIIWRHHYIPITGIDHVEYMLKKYQSAKAIEDQVKNGFEYYIMNYEEIPVGYLSILKEDQSLFLSKIYVLSNYRGKKIGKAAMQFIEDKAKAYHLNKISLTVNRNNTNSIAAYEKMGFVNIGAKVKDIGSGYVMDDYLLEKTLN